jgi:hypothetical protein
MGDDLTLSDKERLHGYWKAAETLRYYGIDLLGTELEPDWVVANGLFQPPDVSSKRFQPDKHTFLLFTAEEQERVSLHTQEIEPWKRWHYRYKSLDLYWEAVELMPDESDDTAKRIWDVGTWMKYKNPQAADRFYKALVNRCRTTWLGQEADRLRWFPKLNREEILGAF